MYLARLIANYSKMRKILVLFCIGLVIASCGDEDDGSLIEGEVVEARSLSDVLQENDADIQEFLSTHFYNYEDFLTPPANFDYRIVLDTIAGDNSDKTPLINQVSDTTIFVSSFEVNLNLDEEETDVPHKLYYLSAREGLGSSVNVADSTLLTYEGRLLDGTTFDGVRSYLWQQLPFFLRGYSAGIARFKTGTDAGLIINNDGTARYNDSGIGLIIMPSALGYFSNSGPTGSLPAYSNLIFQVDLGRTIEDTDTDNDGIPNALEDLDGNKNFFNDNTDLEFELGANLQTLQPNFQDPDDDADGVLTRTEISDDDGNIIIPYPDSNNDGLPDYLDPDTN